MAAYIDRQLLKDRLLLGQLPIPDLDSDLDRLITTASAMVADRVRPFTGDPSAAVQQVTLMLAVRLRQSEIGNYTDAAGTPQPVPLWTQDLTDILGSQIADVTPAEGLGLLPTSGVITRTAPIASPTGWPDANDTRRTGDPNRRLWWGPRP